MLTELYIEALLVDEELADWVWETLEDGLIDDEQAAVAWLLLATRASAMHPKPAVQMLGFRVL